MQQFYFGRLLLLFPFPASSLINFYGAEEQMEAFMVAVLLIRWAILQPLSSKVKQKSKQENKTPKL